ncbi:hypothetical protein [Halpernia frigidisoli]|uniref:Uncharacterized protein n=1 Tax=Halpernia frigidisoli TaxID=1125876 RepID=A0A1I3IH77_9FLAO|nr:hypothetical protein [Halpernia frigidisoli]SFI47348.1 hypothetical protein SAMN05443292_2610 [Halpernia frigidisoli]
MKKLFFSVVATTLLSMNLSAVESNSTVVTKDNVTFSKGTCTMTFTAYGSDGSTYTWTETYWAYSYQNCQDLGKYRLDELNEGN